jgi:RHS repeat-associated protein
VSIQTNPDSSYSLPGVITPNGNSSLASSATYASSWGVTSMTGPNGAQGTTTYDTYGRPSQTKIPDGATTTYTYTNYVAQTNTPATQTATVDGRWKTTTVDGFGRTTRVQTGNGSTVVSTVDTQYAPCACSPLGKMSAVSQPYAPGATPVWNTYTYDGSGRTLTVTAPDGSVTRYACQGNSTTVTDPAGKWKTATVDAFGNVILVTEPNPAGGANLTTGYTYTPANQLATVSMTRGGVAQTRTFVYNGSDLVSATNPENGTVTYTYDNAHHVTSRTDALGQQTQYTYDSYGRLTEVQYFLLDMWHNLNEDTTQRVTYSYDNANQFTQNGLGRLSQATFGGGVADEFNDSYYYLYSYNTAGRVTSQQMAVQAPANGGQGPQLNTWLTFTANYQWDNEGRMTSLQYPTVSLPDNPPWETSFSLQTAAYQYDINGRMTGMTWDSGNGPQPYASATYGPAGEVWTLSYAAGMETRRYNSLLQLTSQSVPGYLNMTYNYSTPGQSNNNGRIVGSVDGITGENTTYTYDALNRLSSATASGMWSYTYSYDGFGNLTAKSGTGAPSMTATYNAQNQQVGGGATYDANGNQTTANNTLNGFTVENRIKTQASTAWPYPPIAEYAYDPHGRRVMKQTDPDPNNPDSTSSWQFNFYGITGQRLVTLGCTGQGYCTVQGQNVYFGRKLLVSNGVTVVTDRLGSVRANTQGQGEKFAYYPYGEERTAPEVDGREKFGTYFRDGVGQDYAMARYYGSGTGRFWSPDPSGINTAKPGKPASWNRYAYVSGDPVNNLDPTGRIEYACGGDDDGDDDYYGSAVCDGGGGSGDDVRCSDNYFWYGFVPTPSPLCYAPVSEPVSEPESPPLTCDFTGYTPDPAPASNGSGPNIGYGLHTPINFNFTASGGNNSYRWSNTNTFVITGSVYYSTNTTLPLTTTGADPGGLTNAGNPPTGPNASFYDAPGIPLFQPAGRVVAAVELFNATLQVTVSSGGQTVQCPTVAWQAFFFEQTVNGKLTSTGQASVILVNGVPYQ